MPCFFDDTPHCPSSYRARGLSKLTGAEGPGVRVITKHAVKGKPALDDGSGVNVMEIGIAAVE